MFANRIDIWMCHSYIVYPYIFKDQIFVDYFSTKDWYVPQYKGEEFDDSVLNEYGKKNLELIKEFE